MRVEHLDLDDLLEIARAAVGEDVVVRDPGLLASAAHRPAQTVYGVEAYPSLVQKAAALVESLVRNHALLDGNKRLGYTALRLFLMLNGADLGGTEDERFDLIVRIADGSLAGVDAITGRLEELLSPGR